MHDKLLKLQCLRREIYIVPEHVHCLGSDVW